ncbi:Sec-independent protein translocase TatB [Microbacterium sp.]|uniref:Sec-independent protein translocase TatB n=1 Tax=Microbacterium sp. TaxID=51671 RepID=UPI003A83EA8C
MFFGLDGEKLLLILFVAALLIGPERLPRYAEALARLTVRAREWLNGAKSRVRDEMGEDFDDIEWQKLDPRQYDPRRIVRDALLDDAPVPKVKAAGVGAAVASTSPSPLKPPVTSGEVPFDSEAT